MNRMKRIVPFMFGVLGFSMFAVSVVWVCIAAPDSLPREAVVWGRVGEVLVMISLLCAAIARAEPSTLIIKRILLSACYVLSLFWVAGFNNGGEVGWLTRPLLYLTDFSAFVFLIAAVLAFVSLRWAGFAGVAASFLSWPWLLYCIDPNIYKPMYWAYKSFDSRVQWSKIMPPPGFSWSPWLWRPVLFLLVTVVSFRAAKTAVIAKPDASSAESNLIGG
jgi:hypothetical protein